MKVPAGVDTDDYEPMVLSGKMTNSDEVLENAVLEKPLDCVMVERTDNTACPGVLVPDVIMLLSDGDSLFDDNNGNVPFEGAPTTLDHLAILSTATATGRCKRNGPLSAAPGTNSDPMWVGDGNKTKTNDH